MPRRLLLAPLLLLCGTLLAAAPAVEQAAACSGPGETCADEPAPPSPKEVMRQRMLASKHRSRGAAALREGEAATALEALQEAQQLTPDDQGLWPLIQRAKMMLAREGQGQGQASAGGGAEDAGTSGNATANATGTTTAKAAAADGTVDAPATALKAGAGDSSAGGAVSEEATVEGTGSELPEGWAEGSLDGTPFYYPVADPSRILWAPPLPQMAVHVPPSDAPQAAAAAPAR